MHPNSDAQYCYLTTTGRTSGEPREIEIWFGLLGGVLYMLSGSGTEAGRPKAQWVRNLLKQPACTIRIEDVTYPATARLVAPGTEEDASARKLLVARYQGDSSGDLASWGRTALVVAFELEAQSTR